MLSVAVAIGSIYTDTRYAPTKQNMVKSALSFVSKCFSKMVFSLVE